MNIYTVKSTDIVHNTSVDLITRWSTKEVHIVQYDNSQPIVAVELFKNSERFVLPDGYEANLRFGKKDRTFIYKPVLGCNQGRDTVYFAVDEQMSMFYGKVTPIIELTYNGAVVGSSSIPFVIDRNPIQIGDVESKSDYPAIVERISATEAAASDAKKAVDTEAVERAAGDAKTLSDARAYTDSSTSGLVSDSTTIKSNITTLQSDVASLKTDNTQNKTGIATKQDKLISGTNIKTINGESILGSGNITINGSSGGSEYFDIHPTNITSTPNNNLEFNITESEYNEILTNKRNVNWVLPAGPEPTSSDETIGIKFEYYTNPGLLYNSAGPVFKSTIVENYNPTVSSNSTLSYATLMLFKDGKSYRGRYSEHCVYRGITMISNEAGYGLILTDKPYNPDKPYEGAVYFGKINGRSVIDNDFELQPTLVSGTNIKTINGESILGSGDITISGGSGSGSGRPPLYSHTITLKDSGNSAYFTFTIYVRTDEEITKDTLFDYLNWNVCSGIGVVSNALIDKIKFSTRADSTWVHQFLELSGQHIDKELSFGNVFGTDFTVEDIVRGPDWIPPR